MKGPRLVEAAVFFAAISRGIREVGFSETRKNGPSVEASRGISLPIILITQSAGGRGTCYLGEAVR